MIGPMLGAATGVMLGAGVWTFIKGGIAALRALARRTKTSKDDAVVAKIDHVASALQEHPELVDVVHQLVRVVTGR